MPNPNLELLELAAERLRQLLPGNRLCRRLRNGFADRRSGRRTVRGTYDVDVIAEIGSYAEYTVFSERLRALGFKEDSREGAPLCRWTHGALTLDVMPLDSQVLGFSNRWYPDALHTAGNVQLRWRAGHSGHQRALLSRDQARSISTDGENEITSRAMTWKTSLP